VSGPSPLKAGYNSSYTRVVKTAISIPDPLFKAAEDLANRLGISRSRLYSLAIERFVEDHRFDGVTERLDEVYCEVAAGVDPLLERIQAITLEDEGW